MSFNLGAPCKHGHRFLLSLGKGSPIFPSSRIERLSTMHARAPDFVSPPAGYDFSLRGQRARTRAYPKHFPSHPRDDHKHSARYSQYTSSWNVYSRERNEEIRNARRDPTKIHVVFPRVEIFLPFSISIFPRLWILGDFNRGLIYIEIELLLCTSNK